MKKIKESLIKMYRNISWNYQISTIWKESKEFHDDNRHFTWFVFIVIFTVWVIIETIQWSIIAMLGSLILFGCEALQEHVIEITTPNGEIVSSFWTVFWYLSLDLFILYFIWTMAINLIVEIIRLVVKLFKKKDNEK